MRRIAFFHHSKINTMSITKIIISQDEYEDTITNVSKKAAAVVLEL